MKKLQIKSFYAVRPENFPGLKCKSKSMTVPGQAVSPQEIARTMTAGPLPPMQFYDEDLSSFERMSLTDRMDFLRDLSERNASMKNNILSQVELLKKQQELENIKKYREKLIAEHEAKKQRDDANSKRDDAK